MSAAFDTIDRSKLMEIIEEIADPDEMRMARALLSKTSLELKLPGFEGEVYIFLSNIGSPQGDGLSGPFFNVYFEKANRDVRQEIASIPAINQHDYANQIIIPLPSQE